jgi:ornithine carbamoyltransferase
MLEQTAYYQLCAKQHPSLFTAAQRDRGADEPGFKDIKGIVMPADFLKLSDCTSGELKYLLEETLRLKRKRSSEKPLMGKSIGMIFTKSSTRTRIGFEVGMYQLGGYAILLRPDEIQLGRGESLEDTAKIMSRYLDGLVVRTDEHSKVEELAKAASIPVINALTDKYHPCQAVADYATLLENKGSLENLKLAYVGDGNNVAHSLIIGAAMLGVEAIIASPKGYAPDEDVVTWANEVIKETGGKLMLTNDPKEAAEGADAVYTDVWVSMGQESDAATRKEAFKGFCVDDELMKVAKPDCVVMHCLPAHRGEEISASVLDGPQSIVLDQAENKLHAQKAVLKMVLGGGKKSV